MIKKYLKLSLLLIVALGFIFSGCSTLDDARKLHRQGKSDEALDIAAKFLDGKPEEQIPALELIGEIGGPKAGALALPLVDEKEEKVKIAAIRAVGLCKYKMADEKLVGMVLTVKGDVFDELATAIGRIDSPATDLLVKKYVKANEADKKIYQNMVVEVGAPISDAIVRSSKPSDPYLERKDKSRLLVLLKDPRVPSILLELIEDDLSVEMVMEGLVEYGSKSTDPIINVLNSYKDKPIVMERLVNILGELKDERAVEVLEKLVKDDSDRVRAAAELALRKIRGF